MHVEIYTLNNAGSNQTAGTLRLEDGAVIADGDNQDLLHGILSKPVLDGKAKRVLQSDADPENFLRALHRQYTSPYLRASEPIEDEDHDDGEALARHYADLWNTMGEHGEPVTHAHLHDAAGELGRGNWRVTYRQREGDWKAHRFDDRRPLREWKGHTPTVAKEHERAPVGGIFLTNLKGESKFYVGGQWIPAKEVANLPPTERMRLEQAVGKAQDAAKMQRAARGDINPTELSDKLSKHSRKLTQPETQRASNELRALHDYHGALTLHRIEQLLHQQEGFLKRPNLTDKQQKQIKDNLARLSAMVGMARKTWGHLGMGKVPKELQQQAAMKAPPLRPKPEDYRAAGKPKPEAAPAKPEEKKPAPASPAANGFLAARAFVHQPQFMTSENEVDAPKALNAMRDLIREHEAGGGKVAWEMAGEKPILVTLQGDKLRDAEGKEWGLGPLLMDSKSGLRFLPPGGKAEVQKPAQMEGKPKPKAEEKPAEPPKQPEPQQDESAFHAAWNKTVKHDADTQNLIRAGKLDAARVRVLGKMIASGLEIPERIKQKYAMVYDQAAKVQAQERQPGDEPPEEEEATPAKTEPAEPVSSHTPRANLTHRQALRQAEKDARRDWSDKALQAGIPPKVLHSTAEQILTQDKEHVEDRRRFLQDARERLATFGYNAQALTTNLRSGRVEDETRGLDAAADSLQRSYPELFQGHERDLPQRLLELFTEGVPQPMPKEDAYEKAFEYLHEQPDPRREASRRPLWEDDEDTYDPGSSQWKALREWLTKGRRRHVETPGQMHLFDESKHPRAPKGPHGGEFTLGSGQAAPADARVNAALDRYAHHQPASGGGLFAGDLEARRGFAKLPDGAPIVFTQGEFEGQTGKIVRDKDALTGAPRIVAQVEGRPGLVPISPDAIEPLQANLSWRVEGGGSGAATEQGGLYTAEQFLPKREGAR